MSKKQFNFRVEEWLLERVKEQAKAQGISTTEWMENACLAELGLSQEDEDASYRITTWRDKDRIKKLEHDIKRFEDNRVKDVEKLDSSLNQLWDSLDYISDEKIERLERIADTLMKCVDLILDRRYEDAKQFHAEMVGDEFGGAIAYLHDEPIKSSKGRNSQ